VGSPSGSLTRWRAAPPVPETRVASAAVSPFNLFILLLVWHQEKTLIIIAMEGG
jgi:hypothetical protein